jgi:hypothetical protein
LNCAVSAFFERATNSVISVTTDHVCLKPQKIEESKRFVQLATTRAMISWWAVRAQNRFRPKDAP